MEATLVLRMVTTEALRAAGVREREREARCGSDVERGSGG